MAGILTMNTGNLKNSRSIKRRKRSKSVRITNGRPGSKLTAKGRTSVNVNRMKAKLLNNGNLPLNGAPQTDNEVAEDLFNVIGISPVYDSNINLVKTLPYKDNYGYFFSSGPNTWHGMEKKEIVKERRCLQVNYVDFKTDWKVD